MNAAWFGVLGVFFVLATSFANLLAEDWRKRLAALAIQSIGVFLLCAQTLPLALSLVKFIEGWMAAAILGSGVANLRANFQSQPPQPEDGTFLNPYPTAMWIFRLATAMLVGMFMLGGASTLMSLFNGLRFTHAIAILGLVGIGLLILSYRLSTFSIAIGLITLINGFEVLLSVIEPSVLLNGLLAGVILSIAFLCTYLISLEGTQVQS